MMRRGDLSPGRVRWVKQHRDEPRLTDRCIVPPPATIAFRRARELLLERLERQSVVEVGRWIRYELYEDDR